MGRGDLVCGFGGDGCGVIKWLDVERVTQFSFRRTANRDNNRGDPEPMDLKIKRLLYKGCKILSYNKSQSDSNKKPEILNYNRRCTARKRGEILSLRKNVM
ncbi:hypothetical protein QVD17_18410 [Tagetes erecta]|uniref:Uncharacterized protein n=1 Tax=Tagetes erecta TaxID=13708 RepID=A0AAD8KP07_TARER|nr:hypothetical protein QVD17_18410 [Tagetes erecta]